MGILYLGGGFGGACFVSSYFHLFKVIVEFSGHIAILYLALFVACRVIRIGGN